MMRCPACGTVNNPGRVYCGGCARAIGADCPVCSFVNETVDRYCGGCARDLLVAVAEPVAPIRVAVVGPAAPVAAVPPVTSAVATGAEGGNRDLLRDLLDLDDLVSGKPGVPSGEQCVLLTTDATQGDVDGFFQRLAREGVARIYPPPSPGPIPGATRSKPS